MFAGCRKTKKNIKKIKNTIDFMLVPIYNIDKLKRVSEQLKKRTAGTARNTQFIITYHATKKGAHLLYTINAKKTNEIQDNKKSNKRKWRRYHGSWLLRFTDVIKKC